MLATFEAKLGRLDPCARKMVKDMFRQERLVDLVIEIEYGRFA